MSVKVIQGLESNKDVLSLHKNIKVEQLQEVNNYFELTFNNKPARIFIDLDGKLKKETLKAFDKKAFNKIVKTTLKELEQIKNVSIMNSSRYESNKLSFRITYINEYCDDMGTMKELVLTEKYKELKEKVSFSIKTKKEADYLNIDTGVYRDGKMRCVNAYKTEDDIRRINKLVKGEIIDTIIHHIPDKAIKRTITKPEVKKEEKIENVIENNKVDEISFLSRLEDIKNKVLKLGLGSFDDYHNWFNLCCIIFNETNGDIKGKELFVELSKKVCKNFNQAECEKKYYSLNEKSSKKLTIGTLNKMYFDKFPEEKKKLEPKVIFPEDKTNKFNTDYFSSLSNYETKKQYFEIFVCKVLRPQPLYVYSENDNKTFNCLLYSEDDIVKTFKHLKASIIKTVKDEQIDKPFIKVWIDDSNLRLYNNMDFLPYNGTRNIKEIIKSDTFNLFNGYNPNINLKLDDKSITNKEKILQPFLDLIFQLAGADKKSCDYLIKFLAHLIQKPTEKIPICIIFKSKQGVGKNLTFDTIGSLIGKHHYITSSNPKDFFGDYAEGFYRKLLVNLNECEGKDTFEFEGKIKSFITEDTITLNPKFVRQTTISNFARTIIFTNKSNPVPIDVRSKDRRFVVFQSTEEYLKNKYGEVFWSKLAEHFKKPEFIKILYDYLNEIDISKIKWKEERPITQAYLDMCKLYIPIEALFLESWIETSKNEPQFKEEKPFYINNYEIKTIGFYNQYVEFCKRYGFISDKSFQPNISKFTSRLSELDLPIVKTRNSETSIFRFIPEDVFKALIKKNWIATTETETKKEEEEEKGEDFNDYFNF